VESAAISKEIEQLEGDLAALRARVDEDNSSFSTLEQQIAALKQRLTETQDAVRTQEAQLAGKRAELAKAQHLERLEAYERDLARVRDARAAVGTSAEKLLAEIEAYDGEIVKLRKLRAEMHDAFGDSEGVAEVDAALRSEADELMSTWKAIAGAVDWRTEVIEAEAETENEDLADDLKKRTEESGRASRILEYFNKS
jgi:chromosome segregation ATPase